MTLRKGHSRNNISEPYVYWDERREAAKHTTMADQTSAGAIDASKTHEPRSEDIVAPTEIEHHQTLVDELPWKFLPAENLLPQVDLRQGSPKTTFFIDPVSKAKAEVVLSAFYDELCARSPRPSWVPLQCLSQRCLICIMLHLMKRHDLLPAFIDNGITDEDIPLDKSKLQMFLNDAKTIKAFHSMQYKSKLRDVDNNGLVVYQENEILPFNTIRSLGHGGFATVDCVKHVLRGYEVAHKAFILTPRVEKRMQDSFEAEIQSLKKLSGYRHIVEYLGAYQSPHCLGLLLSPVAECDLYQFLKSPGSFDFPDGHGILMKSFGCLSSALTYMHSQKSKFYLLLVWGMRLCSHFP